MLAREQVVTFAKIDRIETTTISPNLYEWRPDKGWRWLQRVAFKVLDWIGAHHEATVISVAFIGGDWMHLSGPFNCTIES